MERQPRERQPQRRNPRVKIEDLPKLQDMTPQEQRGIHGGRGGSTGNTGDGNNSEVPEDQISR